MDKLIILILFFPVLCFANEAITVDELLNNQSLHDGKEVLVLGVLHLEFEGNELKSGNSKIALSLSEPTDRSLESMQKYKETYNQYKNNYNGMLVEVRGNFSLEFKGHRDLWPAGIKDVTSITPYNQSSTSPTLKQ